MKNLLFGICLILFFSGCATMNHTQMTVQHPQLVFSPTGKTTRVVASSDVNLSPAYKIEEFELALKQSISKSQLFEISTTENDYLIRAKIVELIAPAMAFDVTITLEVVYLLIDANSNETIATERIKTDYTATVGDAFVGAKRFIMAMEGATKKNIHEFVQKLSELNLN